MRKTLYILILLTTLSIQPSLSQSNDTDKLGMAIEYFQSGKYSEALNLFTKLEKNHNLNPRFKAYIGVCYYYDWNYEQATEYLSKAIPQLEKFSPQEQSFYNYAFSMPRQRKA